MELAYPFNIETQNDEYIITFPDIPEAITGANTREEAVALASDALIAALGAYMEAKQEIPTPSPKSSQQEMAYIPPLAAAKVALYLAMKKEKLSNVSLGDRLGVDEKAVRRMLDLDHATKIETINNALQSVFANRYRLVTSIQSIERA